MIPLPLLLLPSTVWNSVKLRDLWVHLTKFDLLENVFELYSGSEGFRRKIFFDMVEYRTLLLIPPLSLFPSSPPVKMLVVLWNDSRRKRGGMCCGGEGVGPTLPLGLGGPPGVA